MVCGVSKAVIVSMSFETVAFTCFMIFMFLLHKKFKKGRDGTPTPIRNNNTLQSGVSVINSLQFDNSSRNEAMRTQTRMPFVIANIIKSPDIFRRDRLIFDKFIFDKSN
ncbi:hypothetical protein BpHYR1_000167 [Brachionus plicatilis]|uniref:Uncharacterized protein n=1 Tax=Brachionus plicatilis TaxID=10195 RepID=A0A3M7SFH7_BRAPC|nr:hypothetical protein BpHYR1_000167 [Brachionus plicatilis]